MKFLKRIVFISILVCLEACQSSDQYKPQQYLTPAEQEVFLNRIGRYMAKLPKRVYHDAKFDSRYDSYYQDEMKKYEVEKYFITPDSTHYFMVSRPAPSLHEKRIAIGGRLRYAANGDLVAYEEVFRTWKMQKDELERKSSILFKTMLEKGHVDDYLPHKTEDEWVEFPDQRVYFDTTARRWKVVGQNDSLNYQTF